MGKRIVAHIPTCFGRLVYLRSLCDPATGRYYHPSLGETLGREAADRALLHQHHQTFMQWLRLDLAAQRADLDEYLRDTAADLRSLPYREVVPAHAHEVERQLYLTDLEVVLQLISFDRENLSTAGAWPRL
ncbi:MAG: hypothetical protein JST11_16530 [Acidobacteria bacterium]|nr:hypothetical protein [Acidobacteriota bacterium]